MSDQPLLSGHLAIGLTVIHSSSDPSLSPLSLRDGGNMRDLGNELGSETRLLIFLHVLGLFRLNWLSSLLLILLFGRVVFYQCTYLEGIEGKALLIAIFAKAI